eukprot:CAMPEP_0171996070 /NCGR_PEP_ID=MMETSP0993-20121228/279791_1 /TAXON_ID=483369 /ORGANISM="non described non described, Strain CCMP2098" /LENGTH=365 /DNA_ID=CAMNT_0012649183 /DNA_START=25 /DNA_END=1119 /DNA_ORIENTATION=+
MTRNSNSRTKRSAAEEPVAANTRKAAKEPATRAAATKPVKATKAVQASRASKKLKTSPPQDGPGQVLVKSLQVAEERVQAIKLNMIAAAQKEAARQQASKTAAKAAARPPPAPQRRKGEDQPAYVKRLKQFITALSESSEEEDSTDEPDEGEDDSDLHLDSEGYGVSDDDDDAVGEDDDSDDIATLYGQDGVRKAALLREQKIRFAELSKSVAAKESEIQKMANRLHLAEDAARQQHHARPSGKRTYSVDDDSENSDDDDDDDSDDDTNGGMSCRDVNDRNPLEHPDRLTVTECKVTHETDARTQSATLYRNYSIKLQIQGFLEQLLVLKRAEAVLRINLHRITRVIKAGCVDTDLPNARTSMRH